MVQKTLPPATYTKCLLHITTEERWKPSRRGQKRNTVDFYNVQINGKYKVLIVKNKNNN